jgi:hypothetical protein
MNVASLLAAEMVLFFVAVIGMTRKSAAVVQRQTPVSQVG